MLASCKLEYVLLAVTFFDVVDFFVPPETVDSFLIED